MWIRKNTYRAMQKQLATTIHLTYRGESIIGPMTLENLAFIAKFGGRDSEDWLETIAGPNLAGRWELFVEYFHD